MIRGRLLHLTLAAAACALIWVAPAQAATTTTFADVSAKSWARTQIGWAAANGWVQPRTASTFGPQRAATRMAAARMLAHLAKLEHGTAIAANPYTQAVTAGWIGAGTGADQQIQQWELDQGVLRVLGVMPQAKAIGHLVTADGWRPPLPFAFGIEQAIRAIGARTNAPDGFDAWETFPKTPLRRLNLAVEAYAVAHLSSYWQYSLANEAKVATALPAYTPLKRAVLGMALKWAGSPYVWAGEWPTPASPYGAQASGGFDCSGFVWWILKEHTYTLPGGFSWSADAAIQGRSTYDMAQALPVKKRIPYAKLHAGDILFWSTAPDGVNTNWQTVYHAGIYLGQGWAIDSIGSGDGVTLNFMGAGAGWFHDAFAFGWRVMPAGR